MLNLQSLTSDCTAALTQRSKAAQAVLKNVLTSMQSVEALLQKVWVCCSFFCQGVLYSRNFIDVCILPVDYKNKKKNQLWYKHTKTKKHWRGRKNLMRFFRHIAIHFSDTLACSKRAMLAKRMVVPYYVGVLSSHTAVVAANCWFFWCFFLAPG